MSRYAYDYIPILMAGHIPNRPNGQIEYSTAEYYKVPATWLVRSEGDRAEVKRSWYRSVATEYADWGYTA